MQVEKATIWLQLDPHTNEVVQAWSDEYMCKGAAKGELDRMVHTGKWDLREQYPDALARICVPVAYNVTCINGKAVPAV